MLSIALTFVGITLISNGVFILKKQDTKSFMALNIVTAVVLIIGNMIELSKATEQAQYTNVTSGLLFGFTYALIAASMAFGLDGAVSGWYSLLVAIYAIVMGISSVDSGAMNYAFLWFAWAILWGSTFVENILNVKLGKFTAYLCIAEGVFAAFIPAVLMSLGQF